MPASHGRDLELVARVLAGDPAAIDTFVEEMKCIPRFLSVLATSHRRTLTDHDREDLTQQAIAVVWRKLDRYEGRAELKTWVYRIVRFEVLNEVRRKQRSPFLLSEESREDVAPEDDSEPLDYDELHRALDELDPSESEPIRLKHFECLKFTEVAERLGIPPETAKTRYYRGMRRLGQKLGPRLGEEDPA